MSNLISNLTTTLASAEIHIVGKNNGAGEQNLEQNITNILNAIIAVLGLAAVVFIVVGGVNYITSNGEAAKVEKAKKTILYSCIGLIISALAFAIVNFVIFKIIGQASSNNENSSESDKKEEKKKTSYIDRRIQNDLAFYKK